MPWASCDLGLPRFAWGGADVRPATPVVDGGVGTWVPRLWGRASGIGVGSDVTPVADAGRLGAVVGSRRGGGARGRRSGARAPSTPGDFDELRCKFVTKVAPVLEACADAMRAWGLTANVSQALRDTPAKMRRSFDVAMKVERFDGRGPGSLTITAIEGREVLRVVMRVGPGHIGGDYTEHDGLVHADDLTDDMVGGLVATLVERVSARSGARREPGSNRSGTRPRPRASRSRATVARRRRPTGRAWTGRPACSVGVVPAAAPFDLRRRRPGRSTCVAPDSVEISKGRYIRFPSPRRPLEVAVQPEAAGHRPGVQRSWRSPPCPRRRAASARVKSMLASLERP